MRVRTLQDLSALARGRRRELGLSQEELASRAGVSRTWVHDFERGKETVELRKVLVILDALDLLVDVGTGVESQAGGAAYAAELPGGDLVDLDSLLETYREGE